MLFDAKRDPVDTFPSDILHAPVTLCTDFLEVSRFSEVHLTSPQNR